MATFNQNSNAIRRKMKKMIINDKELEKYLRDYLYDDTNCITIEEARAKINKKYPNTSKKTY